MTPLIATVGETTFTAGVCATILLIVSFLHRSYALRQSCLAGSLVYCIDLFMNEYVPGNQEHWSFYVMLDCALIAGLIHLKAPAGAVLAVLVLAVISFMNILSPFGWLWENYEPFWFTLNGAFMYYLAIGPFVFRRDRRWRDRLPAH